MKRIQEEKEEEEQRQLNEIKNLLDEKEKNLTQQVIICPFTL